MKTKKEKRKEETNQSPPVEREFVALDVETTGLSAETAEIIEIAAVRFKDGNVASEFVTFVKPKHFIPEKITNLTGIDETMVNSAPSVEKAMMELKSWMTDVMEGKIPLVIHNASFDLSFLKKAFEYAGIESMRDSLRCIDTLKLSRTLYPKEKHNLSNMAKLLGIKTEGAHRARADAIACGKLYLQLKKECSN